MKTYDTRLRTFDGSLSWSSGADGSSAGSASGMLEPVDPGALSPRGIDAHGGIVSGMDEFDRPPSANNVDWSDPKLKSLLSKTEGWSLDNRGVSAPVPCEIHVGWGAGAGRPGSLVYEQPGVFVVATQAIIPKGEQVRVDRIQAGTLRSTWGVVVDGREGRREEDRARGIHVYWLHTR